MCESKCRHCGKDVACDDATKLCKKCEDEFLGLDGLEDIANHEESGYYTAEEAKARVKFLAKDYNVHFEIAYEKYMAVLHYSGRDE